MPRSAREEAAGCAWLPRMIEKARRAVEGERADRNLLWPYMFGESDKLDGEFLSFLRLRNEDVLDVVRSQPDDAAAAAQVVRRSGRTPEECAAWSAQFKKRWAMAFEIFDADEGRMAPGFKRWFLRAFYNKFYMPVIAEPKYRRSEADRVSNRPG